MAEHHHIAALWLTAEDARVVTIDKATDVFGIDIEANSTDADGWTGRIGIAIGHLIDEEEIADQQRLFHRAGRNPEGLKKQGAEDTGNQKCVDDCLDRLDD